MILLSTTNQKLQIVLAGAVTTNQLPYVTGFVDYVSAGTSVPAPSSSNGTSNSTTDVDVVAAPAASTIRKVSFLSIFNADTVAATVSVKVDDTGTDRIICKVALAVGASLVYDEGQFSTVSATGATTYVSSVASADASVTVTNGTTAADLALNKQWINSALINGHIDASVSGNALTVSVQTPANADPSSSSPVSFLVRDATAATGDLTAVALTAACTVTASSGSSLGVLANEAFKIWVVIFWDSGSSTAYLSLIKCTNHVVGPPEEISICSLNEDQLASSTAEGGAGAADSAQVFYTSTAVTAKPFRVLGYLEWSSGLATPGTWASPPTKTQQRTPGLALPGTTIQSISYETGAVATGTTTIPNDDSIPQLTGEGDLYLSKAITPISASNSIDVIAQVIMTNSAAGENTAALFRDSTENALAATGANPFGAGGVATGPLSLRKRVIAGSTSSSTFKAKAGGSAAGTTTVNGVTGARQYGGVNNSYMHLSEIVG